MRVLYLTMNPNRQSTTVPTEGWPRLLPTKGLDWKDHQQSSGTHE
jgi:hypothetical protein